MEWWNPTLYYWIRANQKEVAFVDPFLLYSFSLLQLYTKNTVSNEWNTWLLPEKRISWGEWHWSEHLLTFYIEFLQKDHYAFHDRHDEDDVVSDQRVPFSILQVLLLEMSLLGFQGQLPNHKNQCHNPSGVSFDHRCVTFLLWYPTLKVLI